MSSTKRGTSRAAKKKPTPSKEVAHAKPKKGEGQRVRNSNYLNFLIVQIR
jgi:hypothetical protein